jgi:hypothetical protein
MSDIPTAEAALAVSGVAGLGGLWNALRLSRWQRQRDHERRETRLHFAFEHSSRRLEGPHIIASAPDPPPPATEYRLRVVVVNVSETSTVWIREVDIEQVRGEEGVNLTYHFDGATRLEPGEPLVLDFFPQRDRIDFSGGVQVNAHLAPNLWITSHAERLMDDLLERTSGRPKRTSATAMSAAADEG